MAHHKSAEKRIRQTPKRTLRNRARVSQIKTEVKKAETALGPKFSLPWFHDVLKDGIMPLSLLEQRVDARIAERLRE